MKSSSKIVLQKKARQNHTQSKNVLPKILLIDNYDSFTYNLYQYIESLGSPCTVIRNDAITLRGISNLKPTAIVISPGPGEPVSAGISLSVIKHFSGKIPLLGVCLGHQAIGHAFGGKVVRSPRPKHGKVSEILHQGRGLYKNMPMPFLAARYHSLIVERVSLPSVLEVTAETADGTIMGLRHKRFNVEGVQFHPESVATTDGKQLIKNFLNNAKKND